MRKKPASDGLVLEFSNPKTNKSPLVIDQIELIDAMALRRKVRETKRELAQLSSRLMDRLESGAEIDPGPIDLALKSTDLNGTRETRLYLDGLPLVED